MEPLTNADDSIRGWYRSTGARVALVAHIGESPVHIVPLSDVNSDVAGPVPVPGQEYTLPDGTAYTAGYEAGTPVLITAMAPVRNGAYLTLKDAQSGEDIKLSSTVADALKLSIKPEKKLYDIGKGTAIVEPGSTVSITTNSDWQEHMYLTIGDDEPILVQLSREYPFVISTDGFVQAKHFNKGDKLTEILAQVHRPSNATANLNVGVDTYDELIRKSGSDADGVAFPALIVSPVAEGVGFVAGFAPYGSEVYVSIGKNVHYSDDSEDYHSFVIEGEDDESTEDDILYFYINLDAPLEKGQAVFAKWIDSNSNVRRVTMAVDRFDEVAAMRTWAEAYGESILGGWWNEEETIYTPDHHFVLNVKASDFEESFETPIFAYGGYRIGSLKIEKAEGGMKVSYTIGLDIAGHDGKVQLISFSEKPEFEQLREAILQGNSLSIGQTIAEEEFWLYAAFEVKDLHLPMQAEDESFHVIGR